MGDPARQADIERTGGKLKAILTGIEKEIEGERITVMLTQTTEAQLYDSDW